MPDSPVKKLLQDETQKHALIGHLPREVAVMYREALAEIEQLERVLRDVDTVVATGYGPAAAARIAEILRAHKAGQ